jgi:hypothetical protein
LFDVVVMRNASVGIRPKMQEAIELSDSFAGSKPPRQAGAYESGGKPPHSKWAVPMDTE